jgi:hypothetical protein
MKETVTELGGAIIAYVAVPTVDSTLFVLLI